MDHIVRGANQRRNVIQSNRQMVNDMQMVVIQEHKHETVQVIHCARYATGKIQM